MYDKMEPVRPGRREIRPPEGYKVVEPGLDEVFVDLDAPADRYVMDAVLPVLQSNGVPLELVRVTRSRSGSGRHAVLRWPGRALTELERVALQAVLGSDRKREALGVCRAFVGEVPNTVFFEPEPAETGFLVG